MKTLTTGILGLLFLVLFANCSTTEMDYSSANDIDIKWELLTNFAEVPGVFDARFVFENKSGIDLSDNWKLFFNIAPREIIDSPEPQMAAVEHINGDWYQLVPKDGFKLLVGESVEIQYRGNGGLNKVTDAPLGLYFVFYDENNQEKQIVEVECEILPFTEENQLNRSATDFEPIPTAEYRYQNNAGLSELSHEKHLKVIPTPFRIKQQNGIVSVDNSWGIQVEEGLESEGKFLSQKLQDITGSSFAINGDAEKSIRLAKSNIKVNGKTKEAYTLNIQSNQIIINGSDPSGVFYGIQSLLALIPLKTYKEKDRSFELELLQIEDAPRFHFRGLHTDLGRNFQTKETILKTLDIMAFYKVNKYLFYMTEDEGWRLEIPDLPELTDIGGQREHTSSYHDPVLHPAYGSGPFAYGEGSHGSGYIRRSEFIEILQYAKERHIQVIPEVNFPGHARSAIMPMEARYQRLMAEGKEEEANEYRLIDPDDKSKYLSAQFYKDNIVSVSRPSTYRFYKKVMDEIAKMYKEAGLELTDIHTGGDEVPEGSWTESPMAAEVMKENPQYKDPKNLQAYFFKRLIETLKDDNYRLHGWEEVALIKNENGRYDPNPEFVDKQVIPYVWNNLYGNQDLAYRIANAGYQIVLCPVSAFYFDLAYDKDPLEPGLYWAGYVRTRDAWSFAPFDLFKTTTHEANGREVNIQEEYANMERLKPEAQKNILGLEAQLWSETIKGREMFEYYMLPKLLGFAERAWAGERTWENIEDQEKREKAMEIEWNAFANTVAIRELPRLNYINEGYNYRLPLPGAVIDYDGLLKANIEFPGLKLRYTTDGSEPTVESNEYVGPVQVDGEVKIKAFDSTGKSSRTVEPKPIPIEQPG